MSGCITLSASNFSSSEFKPLEIETNERVQLLRYLKEVQANNELEKFVAMTRVNGLNGMINLL